MSIGMSSLRFESSWVRSKEMATSRETESAYSCSICFEILRNPKSLPCQHNFCELCIQEFIEISISNCVKYRRAISFDCPVCRRVITPPANNISAAKEWTDKLPINHQLCDIIESYQKQTKVCCESCRQKNKEVIATIRCHQCRENLCKACCKSIHDRVKAFGLHTFVDLGSTNTEINTVIEPENCVFHTDRPLEVYCFEHGGLCCIYCLTTVHKDCKNVLSLDEIDERDIENSSESCINETKQMRNLTSCNILDTKKNIHDLNQEKNEVLESVAKKIEDIKQRLDNLHSKFQNSLGSTYDKETTDLLSLLKTLEDFDNTLAQSENIACTVMQKGTKKQIFIAMEKMKLRLSDHLKSLTAKTKHFKRSKIKWTYIDEVERLSGLTKLGDLECINERFDFITPIKKHYNAMEKDGNLREKAKENTSTDKKQGQRIDAPGSSDISKIKKSDTELCTYSGGMKAPSNALGVAAIDLGNTFSGYAFATRNDLDIIHVSKWCSNSGMISSKTPTTVLLNKDQQFVASGFEAEDKYTDLLENEEDEDYFYFRHFKMMLYDHAKSKNLTIDTKVSDTRGRELPAVKVFTCAIESLLSNFLNDLERSRLDISWRDMYWVLTVPGFWDDKAKEFMRNAAQKAGIPLGQIIIALEPEAAIQHVKELDATNPISPFRPGSKYLYLDAGGTVDIIVFEVERNGDIRELYRSSEKDLGGTSVDMAFRGALTEIVTEEMLENYSQRYQGDYIELFRSFEIKKRSCHRGIDPHSSIRLNIPISLCREFFDTLDTDLSTLIDNSSLKDYMNIRRDQIRIKLTFFETFFRPACDGITKHIRDLFQTPKFSDVNEILMVGGFSESYVLQDAIREAFPNCKVIVPKEADLAVQRGAVTFGHL